MDIGDTVYTLIHIFLYTSVIFRSDMFTKHQPYLRFRKLGCQEFTLSYSLVRFKHLTAKALPYNPQIWWINSHATEIALFFITMKYNDKSNYEFANGELLISIK